MSMWRNMLVMILTFVEISGVTNPSCEAAQLLLWEHSEEVLHLWVQLLWYFWVEISLIWTRVGLSGLTLWKVGVWEYFCGKLIKDVLLMQEELGKQLFSQWQWHTIVFIGNRVSCCTFTGIVRAPIALSYITKLSKYPLIYDYLYLSHGRKLFTTLTNWLK